MWEYYKTSYYPELSREKFVDHSTTSSASAEFSQTSWTSWGRPYKSLKADADDEGDTVWAISQLTGEQTFKATTYQDGTSTRGYTYRSSTAEGGGLTKWTTREIAVEAVATTHSIGEPQYMGGGHGTLWNPTNTGETSWEYAETRKTKDMTTKMYDLAVWTESPQTSMTSRELTCHKTATKIWTRVTYSSDYCFDEDGFSETRIHGEGEEWCYTTLYIPPGALDYSACHDATHGGSDLEVVNPATTQSLLSSEDECGNERWYWDDTNTYNTLGGCWGWTWHTKKSTEDEFAENTSINCTRKTWDGTVSGVQSYSCPNPL